MSMTLMMLRLLSQLILQVFQKVEVSIRVSESKIGARKLMIRLVRNGKALGDQTDDKERSNQNGDTADVQTLENRIDEDDSDLLPMVDVGQIEEEEEEILDINSSAPPRIRLKRRKQVISGNKKKKLRMHST